MVKTGCVLVNLSTDSQGRTTSGVGACVHLCVLVLSGRVVYDGGSNRITKILNPSLCQSSDTNPKITTNI